MIRRTNDKDIKTLTVLLYCMYKEVFPDYYTEDLRVYSDYIETVMVDSKATFFMDSEAKGFMLVLDVSEPMTPNLTRIDGNKVYILPKYRNSRVLSEFYATLFKEYPDGDILGITEVNSKHIAVLEKRHTHIANVYKLNRS